MVHQPDRTAIGAKRRPATSGLARAAILTALFLVPISASPPAHANNYGENGSWQFQSSTDAGNLAAVQDMIQKKRSGDYNPVAPPVYNSYTTIIGHQTNCSVGASAVGNSGTASAAASSPTTSGAAASSLANSNANSSTPGYGSGTSSLGASQSNSGTLGAGVNGSTNVTAQGGNYQALNSTQSNMATQTASIAGSTACAYGALN
ncbi:MAG TPA: hypothetical protein VMB34_17030 [Acetobacteraceae bacterium]|nr:hypothetical protein [Acetobacteraceae bacterium]